MSTSFVGITEGNDKNIATHSFTEDGIEKQAERVAIGTGILIFPGTPQVNSVSTTGIYPSSSFVNIDGLGYVIVKTAFSDTGQTCKIKLVLYDLNGKLIGETSEQTITDMGKTEDSKYIGQMLTFENKIGASKFKIEITQTPSTGDVSFYIAGV